MTKNLCTQSNELGLLLLLSLPNAATRWPDKIASLMSQIDQLEFIRLIRFHRVALAVNRNLMPHWRQLLSPTVLAQLEQQSAQQQKLIRQQYFQQNCVQKAFNEAGITHRFFKGLALSNLLYQDLGWRFSKDIDVLIDISDRQRASLLLQKFGFVSEFSDLPSDGLGTRLRQALQKDCIFNKTDGTILELHWRLDNAHGRYDKHMANYYLTQPEGFCVDEFVYLCLHAAKTQCHRIKWLIDVVVYAKKLEQIAPDWQRRAEILSSDYGVLPQLRIMLLLIQQFYDDELNIVLQPGINELQRATTICLSWQHGVLPKRATGKGVIKRFLVSMPVGDRARLLVNLMYWPNPDDISVLNRLPLPLNYLFLPFLPCYKLGRYLFRVTQLFITKHLVRQANDTNT